MIRSVIRTDSTGKISPTKLAEFTTWTIFYVQIKTPDSLFLAAGQQELAQPQGVGGANNGLEITQADGIQKLSWIGELWGLGSANALLIDFQQPALIPGKQSSQLEGIAA